jgi:DNA-binding response OmpR family regulator
MRVLYVEDEKYLADAVKHNLEKQGIKVDHAADGEAGLDLAMQDSYDCIVLDIMLPKMSGIEILKHIRKNNINTPVIMLSALSEVEDKVRGLDSGADDYLAKPFKTVELIARINALLRRPLKIVDKAYNFEDLTYDINQKTLNGYTLTAKEAMIVSELIRNPEKLIQKDFLLNKIWGGEKYTEENYIEVYMSRIRRLLKKIGTKTQIKNLRGLGYKLTKR